METFRTALRFLLGAAVVLSATTLVLVLVEEEAGRETAVVFDPGSWGGVRALVEDSSSLRALQVSAPGGRPDARIAVCAYPLTIEGLHRAGRATAIAGAEVLGHFRVEGIANAFLWEHVRTLGLRPDRTYVSSSDLRLHETIDAALRRRFGADAVRPLRRGVPGNYVLEVDRSRDETARTTLTLVPTEAGDLEQGLLSTVLVVSTVEEAGLLPDLSSPGGLGAVEFREGAVVSLFDPRIRRYLSALGVPIVLPDGVSAPPGVRAVPAARIPPGATAADAVDRVRATRARVVFLRGEAAAVGDAALALEEAGYRLGSPRPPGRLRGLFVLPMLLLWPAFLAVVAEHVGVRSLPAFVGAVAAVVVAHVLLGPGAAASILAATIAAAGGAWGLLRWEEAGPSAAPPLVDAASVVAMTAAASLGTAGLVALGLPAPVPAVGRVFLLSAAVYTAAQFSVGVPPGRPARTLALLAALAAWASAPALLPLADRFTSAAAAAAGWGITPSRAVAAAGGVALYLRTAHLAERSRLGLSLLAVLGQCALLLEAADPGRSVLGRLLSAALLGVGVPAAAAAAHLAAVWYLSSPEEEEEDEPSRER